MLADQDLTENGINALSLKKSVSDLNVVAGWELDLDTLELTIDLQHRQLLTALGAGSPGDRFNLHEYSTGFIAEDDLPLISERIAYARQNRENPDYADRFEIRLKAADGTLYYFLINVWLLRPGMLRGYGQNITEFKRAGDPLDFSSAAIRSLLESTGDYSFICSCEGTLLAWNSGFETIAKDFFQVNPAQGIPLRELVPAGIYEQWTPLLSEAAGGIRSSVELNVQLPDLYHWEVSVNPLRKNDQVAGVSFFIRDITTRWRKTTWESLETKVLENAFRNESLPDVFDMLLLGIQELAPEMTCFITRKIDSKMALEWVSAPSLPPSYTAGIPEIPVEPSAGSCGLSAATMQPAYVKDIREHDSWEKHKDVALLHGFFSCYSFPVISKEGRILGTLGAYFRAPHEASDFELSLWQRALNLVGILLEKESNEREVKRKNDQLDEIAASIPGVLYKVRTDPDGHREFEYISKKAGQFLGRPLGSVNQDYMSMVSLMREEQIPDLKKEIERSMRDRDTAAFEFSLRSDINPEPHTYKLLSSHVFKEDGTVYSYGTIFDITNLKKTERMLMASKEEMEILLRCLDDLVFVIDDEHRFVDAFSNEDSGFLFEKETFIGKSIFDFLPQHVSGPYLQAIASIKSGNDTAGFFYELNGGEKRSYYKAEVKTIQGRSRFLVTVKDVTSERSVVEINNKLQSVLDDAGEYGRFGIFEFNVSKGRLLWSAQLRKVMGVPDDLNDANLYDFYIKAIHPDDREQMEKIISEASQHALDFEKEHRIQHYNGHYIWLYCLGRSNRDEVSGDTLIRGIAMDITAGKKSDEEKKRKANLLEAVSLLSMNLVNDAVLDDSIHNLLAKVGETIGVSRILLFRNSWDGTDSELYGELLTEWCASDALEVREHTAMKKLNVRDSGFGRWITSLQEGIPVFGEVANMPEPEREFLSARSVKSILIVPILLDGNWWGVLAFEVCDEHYSRQEEEVTILSAVANLIGSVIERKRVRDDLVKSEMYHRSIVETMAEGLLILDMNGNPADCNPAAEKILRMSKERILTVNSGEFTKGLIRLDGTCFSETESLAYRTITTGNQVTGEVMGFCEEGKPELWVSVNASPLKDPVTGAIVGAVETFTDITERVLQDRELNRNLAQKEVLLTEVHHRVKNNLAIVSSLLQLQQLYTKDKQVREMLQESRGRLRSMSLVHEILYKSGDFSSISFDSYLMEIGEYLRMTFAKPDQEILFEISADQCNLEITKAIPCGLIVNELVTNAFKYAFADRNEGLMVISLRLNGEYYVLEICDDGPGLPQNFNWKESTTMGFTIVRTLSAQLKGVLSVENKNGARLVLTFPK